MKALIFDTETTGKANFKAPKDCSTHPRMIQLGAMFIDVDEKNFTFDEVAATSLLIRPEGFVIPSEAENIHGISTQRAKDCGIGLNVACATFLDLLYQADVLMAYNIEYDIRVMMAELRRLGQDEHVQYLDSCTQHCIMKPMTSICKLPTSWGRGYKWPKLEEAYHHCFGVAMEDAHDAMADVRASVQVHMWRLERHGHEQAGNTTSRNN